MSNLVPRGLVCVSVAAVLLAATTPAHAAGAAAVPATHVKVCADDGLKDAASMTRVSSAAAKESSQGHTSRANAWVYAVPGEASRCVVVQLTGAKVRTRKSQSAQTSVGYVGARSSTGVMDTGEVLAFNHESFAYGGTSERTRLMAQVQDLVEETRVPDDVSALFPPSLAGLAGHSVTVTLSSLEYTVSSSAWVTTQLSKPLTKAQQKKKQAREIKVAKACYDERMVEASTTRDAQLVLAAGTTGLPAAWLTFVAEDEFSKTAAMARSALSASRSIARQNAARAGKGSDTRESFAHEFTLLVPVS